MINAPASRLKKSCWGVGGEKQFPILLRVNDLLIELLRQCAELAETEFFEKATIGFHGVGLA